MNMVNLRYLVGDAPKQIYALQVSNMEYFRSLKARIVQAISRRSQRLGMGRGGLINERALSRICPEDMLDAIRRERYGDYENFRCADPEEALLRLDRASHVPNDSEQTVLFRQTIESYVNTLAKELSAVDFPQLGKVTFTPKPMGSFPCNTKVGDIDEFDYILLLENSKLEEDFLKNAEEAKKNGRFETKYENPATFDKEGAKFGLDILLERITTLIHTKCDLDVSSGILTRNWVGLTDFYSHGPAICVELGWRCPRGHRHHVGIDLAFGFLLNNWPLSEYLQERQLKRGDQALPAEVYDRMCEKVGMKNTMFVYNGMEWVMSASVLDQPMFETLQEMFPAIITAFRILKLISSNILPSKILCSIKGYRRCKVTNLISSYYLKTHVFTLICNTSSVEEWSRHTVYDIVHTVLGVLCEAIEQKEFFLDFFHQGIYCTKVFPPSDLYNEQAWYTAEEAASDLRALIRFLESLDDMKSIQLKEHSSIIYIREKRRTHRANKSFLDTYYPAEISKMFVHKYNEAIYRKHHLIRMCDEYTIAFYQKDKGIDLETIHNSYIVRLWNKYARGYLSLELMLSFNKKVSLFKNYLRRHDRSEDDVVSVAQAYDSGRITEDTLLGS